jgi:uncharacterized damage-inducible protein DinB
MYQTISDFLEDWRGESIATQRIFRALTDASLHQRVTPEGRSLGFLAWHLTVTLAEMGGTAGLPVEGPEPESPVPATAADIAAAYVEASESLKRSVAEGWTDEALQEEIDMYGEKWTRSMMLVSLIKHQTHHRAQMTILMRQAGLAVPGIYGPSKEEWSKLGMPPQD